VPAALSRRKVHTPCSGRIASAASPFHRIHLHNRKREMKSEKKAKREKKTLSIRRDLRGQVFRRRRQGPVAAPQWSPKWRRYWEISSKISLRWLWVSSLGRNSSCFQNLMPFSLLSSLSKTLSDLNFEIPLRVSCVIKPLFLLFFFFFFFFSFSFFFFFFFFFLTVNLLIFLI